MNWGRRTALGAVVAFAALFGAATAEAAITCVPYARKESGLKLYGDGWTWWHQAEGKYARDWRPRAGAVLVFDRTGAMRHGHVAVVKQIVDRRRIVVDHANWGGPGVRKGQIHKGVAVIDTSAANDWSSVRVWYAPGRDFGMRDYPTLGFVHAGAPGVDDNPGKARKKPSAKPQTVKAKASPAPKPVEKPSPELPVQIAELPDRL
jgi:surface antigen